MESLSIIVVGGGPVGLLTTLRLAQAGIQVTCIECLDAIDASPRAMVYHPVAVKEIARAGILKDCRRIGSAGHGVCWRITKSKEVIAEINRTPTKEFPYENLLIGQHLLAGIILDHLKRYENAKVLFSTKVTALDQASGDRVNLTVESSAGSSQLIATYCVAADGGRSTVRRLLDIAFEGFTYEEQLVSTNVYFDFPRRGWLDANFLIDPEHWALIAKINNKGLWRVSYGEKSGLALDEIKERIPWKFERLFPGGAEGYRLDQMSPYRLNQRCASTFRKGRVVLAGDAAHLCNPFGGLGLTSGILDCAAVSDALIGIYEGKVSDGILDKYAELRRKVFVEMVDPMSQKNKMRLHDKNPETIGDRDPFLKMLRSATAEEVQRMRANDGLAVDMAEFFDAVPTIGKETEQQALGLQEKGAQITTVH